MIALLNSSGLQKRARPLSVAAWHAMIRQNLAPARAELIRGVIFEKMSKSILHIRLSDSLLDLFKFALRATHWTRQDAPLTCLDSEPEPDISVVRGRSSDYARHPTTAALVVEVAVSTLADDRELADLYAEAGVEEYWVVNAVGRSIEVYRLPVNGHYTQMTTYTEGQSLPCSSLPVTVDLGALFAGLPVE
jgi:Uma2 family endonuclease